MTTLGTNVDGSVRRMDTAYDKQGNAYLFTSYADTSAAAVVNHALKVPDPFTPFLKVPDPFTPPLRLGIRLEDCVSMTQQGPRWFTLPSPAIDKPFA